MKKFFVSLTLLNILTLCSAVAFAQIGVEKSAATEPIKGPSLEETTTWLAEKIAMAPKTRYGDVPDIKTAFRGCEMTRTIVKPHDTRITSVDIVKLNARDIDIGDANRINDIDSRPFPASRLMLWNLGRENLTVTKIIYAHPENLAAGMFPPQEIESRVIFYFPDRELSERVKSAFQHAIKLCNRQAADKKAAEPPKPRETF